MDPTLAARLIDLYNVQFAKIVAAVRTKGNEDVLRRNVESFLGGSTGLWEFFRGVTLGNDGTLPRERVIENLAAIRVSQKLGPLFQALHELLDYMLFGAMEAIDCMDEKALGRQVREILNEAARSEGRTSEGSPASRTPIEVLDLEDPAMRPVPPDLPPVEFHSPRIGPPIMMGLVPPPGSDEPMPPSGQTSVTMVPYLPDGQVYEWASAIRAAKTEAMFAFERAEDIASRVDTAELREAALRCREHAASAIRALDQLEQFLQRLRRR